MIAYTSLTVLCGNYGRIYPEVKSVEVRYRDFWAELYLPVFLEQASLSGIRKMFKMLLSASWQNERALEKLERFFTEWAAVLKDIPPTAANIPVVKNAVKRYGMTLKAYNEISAKYSR